MSERPAQRTQAKQADRHAEPRGGIDIVPEGQTVPQKDKQSPEGQTLPKSNHLATLSNITLNQKSKVKSQKSKVKS